MKYVLALLVSLLVLSGCSDEPDEREAFQISMQNSWDDLTKTDQEYLCLGFHNQPDMVLGMLMTVAEDKGIVTPHTEDDAVKFLDDTCSTE